MQPAKTLLLATGTLLLAGCSLLINEQLDEKGAFGGAGGGGGQVASSTASMTTSVTATTSVAHGASSSSGGCGSACTLANAISSCVDGACAITACTGKFDDCDKKPENGCEASLNADSDHCGKCDHACSSKDMCSGGKCE